MKTSSKAVLLLLAALVASPSVFAEEEHDASEDTMIVVQAGATPEDIVNIIELPVASSSAAEHAAKGIGTAGNASKHGRVFDQQTSEDAKSKNISEHIRDDLYQNARRDARGANGKGQQ